MSIETHWKSLLKGATSLPCFHFPDLSSTLFFVHNIETIMESLFQLYSFLTSFPYGVLLYCIISIFVPNTGKVAYSSVTRFIWRWFLEILFHMCRPAWNEAFLRLRLWFVFLTENMVLLRSFASWVWKISYDAAATANGFCCCSILSLACLSCFCNFWERQWIFHNSNFHVDYLHVLVFHSGFCFDFLVYTISGSYLNFIVHYSMVACGRTPWNLY